MSFCSPMSFCVTKVVKEGDLSKILFWRYPDYQGLIYQIDIRVFLIL